MAITLGSNIASLRGQRQLSRTSAELGTVFQRLSSGQRINKASDDAAGLSIADSLNARSRIYNQGVRNLNDGLSLLSIADSAIENLGSIVIRLEELAVQSANGVYTNKQRKALDAEAQALGKEFFRISKTAEFNGQRLLSGDTDAVNLQAGVGASSVLSAGIGGAIGTGSFTSGAFSALASNGSFGAKLGDLNGDGILDLVTAGYSGANDWVSVQLGSGGGTFGAAASYSTGAGLTRDVSLGDINGDGILDLVTTGTSAGSGRTIARLGRGDGSFGTAISYAESGAPRTVSLGDLDGDGRLDLVTASGALATIRLGQGDGSFGAAQTVSVGNAGTQAVSLTLGDLNGDGMLDLAVGAYSGSNSGQVSLLLGSGAGSFGTATIYSGGTGTSFDDIKLGDLNGDGVLDVIAAGDYQGSYDGQAVVWLGKGDGSLNTGQMYLMQGTNVVGVSLDIGDLNGDGFLDLVTVGYESPGAGLANVRLGTGNGSFGAAVSFATQSGVSRALALGDLDGDGVLDLATVGSGAGGQLMLRYGTTRDGVAPLLPFSLKTLADARQALPVFKRKRAQLAAQRGEIGAFQSRIDVARNVLGVSSENFKAAESRIRDADIAEESSRLVRLNILQQAASAILAQANQQPALALQLLGRT